MRRAREALIPAYLLLCLVLGGASAGGIWANMVLQLLGIPIILWALLRPSSPLRSRPAQRLTLLAGLAVALAVVQLVPMPPILWSSLPGRADIVSGYVMLGVELPWLPISLAPYDSVSAVLWLLPAFAVLLGALRLDGVRAKSIATAVAIATILSVALGLLQVILGSPFYLYAVSDFGLFAGFFANAANLALLLLAALPLFVALYLTTESRAENVKKTRIELALLMVAIFAVVTGLFLNASLAAAGLSGPVLFACLCLILRRKGRISPFWYAPIAMLSVAYIVVGSFTPFQNEHVWNEAVAGPESRHPALGTSVAAAMTYLPVGSGVGTFPDIYRQYEDAAAVGRIYINHIHNDYIELMIETGLPGLILILAVLAWWGRRAHAIWLSQSAGHMARAATISSGAILLQSALGYPLRTAALGAFFAACCALMARPRAPRRTPSSGAAVVRHLSAG